MTRDRSLRSAATSCASAVLLVLASCQSSLAGPEAIASDLHLNATEVSFGESFIVTLKLQNTTDRNVTLRSPMGCVALPSVYRDAERLDWDGTALGCTAAVTSWVVPARDSMVVAFELRAALRGGTDPFDYEVEPEPGVYEVRMETYVLLPDLSAEFLVR